MDKVERAEKRKAAMARQKLAWRMLAIAAAGWILAVLSMPLGVTRGLTYATADTRLFISYGLAAVSLVAASVALLAFKPWKRFGMRSFALSLTALAIILGDTYVLSWMVRL